MRTAKYDEEAARVSAKIPAGFRVAVIGSGSFRHRESEQTCTAIGERLGDFADLVLLTGGIWGVGDTVGQGYVKRCRELGRAAKVFHILPCGFDSRDYGTTLFSGSEMGERREILGRLASIFVMVEGGPGTEHEAKVAMTQGAHLVPVGRSGGYAGTLYPSLTAPWFINERSWHTLGDPNAAPQTVAEAVLETVTALMRHDLSIHDQSEGRDQSIA